MIVAHSTDISYETTAFIDEEQLDTFTYLYGRFHQKVYTHVYRLLTHPQDAEDVTQEVFLRVHKKWHSLYDHHNLLPWLYLVATNLSIDLLRLRLHISSYLSLTDSGDCDDETHSSAFKALSRENTYGSEQNIANVAEREHISLALVRMPKRDVQILLLSTIFDLSYQEVALKLDISASAAAARITRAKKRFKREYRSILTKDDIFLERREKHDNDTPHK